MSPPAPSSDNVLIPFKGSTFDRHQHSQAEEDLQCGEDLATDPKMDDGRGKCPVKGYGSHELHLESDEIVQTASAVNQDEDLKKE